jgi:hypothetical protein
MEGVTVHDTRHDEPLTIAYLKAKRTQYRCIRATRLAFMDPDPNASHVDDADVMRCYTATFHVLKDIALMGLTIYDYEPHAREVILTLLHGFCLRTNRAEMVKPQKREYVYVKGGVKIEFLVSEPVDEEARRLNDTEQDTRRIVGHRYRFMFYAKRDTIHQAAQAAYNKKAGQPVGNPVNFSPDDSVMRWDPMDEAIRMAVADNAELCKKIQQIHSKPTGTRGTSAYVGSLAHNKDVLTLPAYSFIKHTRIDQFYANGIVR